MDSSLVKNFGKARVELREEAVFDDFSYSIANRKGEMESFHIRQAEKVKKIMNLSASTEEVQKRIDTNLYSVWERSYRGVRACSGLHELLNLLKEKNLTLGILSDFPVQNKLRYLGIPSSTFSVQVCAEDTGYLKPHPEPFNVLAQQCGCEPGEILYIGNSYDKDVVGAKNAGMLAAHFTRKKLPGSVADINFKDYGNLEGKLKKIMID